MLPSRGLVALGGALAALLLCTAPAPAQGAGDPGGAADVVRAGIEALGGHDVVLGARRLAFTLEGIGYAPGQARRPYDPVAEVPRELHYLLDTERQRLRHESLTIFPGAMRFAALLVLEPEGGFALDPLGWREGSDLQRFEGPPLQANLAAAGRLLPHLALQQALEHEVTLAEEDASGEGDAQRVISYRDPTGAEVRLHFDGATRRLAKLQVTRGAQTSEVSFLEYRAIEGLQIPHRTVTRRNGVLAEEVRLTRVELNPRLSDDLFAVPAGYREPPAPGEPRAVAMGSGVHLLEGLPGAYRSLVVEMDDHLVVLEAPHSPAHAQAALQLIRQTLPGKPVRYVLVTHHHGDHVGGVGTFAAEGATIIAGSGTEEALRRELARQGIESPERVRIETVAERRTLGSGARRIEIYAVPNPHADGSLIFYLPAGRLLFQGDLLYLPERGPVPAAFDAAEALERAVRRHGLAVETIVGVHGRAGTMRDLREALEKRER